MFQKCTIVSVVLTLAILGFSSCQPFQEDFLESSDNVCPSGELRIETSFPDCKTDIGACESRCRAGDGAYCLSWAWTLEAINADRNKVEKIFRRACENGLAVACTNYAASIWSRENTKTELDCANSLFSKSCEAGESYGCGMSARSMVDAAKSKEDLKKAETFLKSKCDALGGFPCRVLAKHYEKGDFKAEKPDIKGLLKKACEGGDRDACKSGESASDTFTER